MAKKTSISQCMIVKDEEKNIRQALSWAKSIVQEQIVVDTGSTDNTVEIARSMGAKIFHFEWCDDFSAAKNFAVERASGDWIVFLDADEYCTPEDTKKIPEIIREMEKQFPGDQMPDVIRATWAQLNDEGNVFSVSEQDRIFRNRGDIRFQNPIHEILVSNQGKKLRWLDVTELLSIMHTGYLRSVISEKGKRNVPILRRIVQNNPDDYDSLGYLSESLLAQGEDEEALQAAEKVLEEGFYKAQEPRINAALMTWYTAASSGNTGNPVQYKEKAYRFYKCYCEAGYSFPDIEFGMGCYLMKIGETQAVIPFFETALQKLEQYKGVNDLKMAGSLNHIYSHLAMFYSESGNAQKAVYYSTLSLRIERFQEAPLSCLLELLKKDRNTTAEAAYVFLGKIYELASQKDRLFILKQAVKTGYQELKEFIRSQMPRDELEALDSAARNPWILDTEELKKKYPQIPVRNRTDRNFLYLIGELEYREAGELNQNSLIGEPAKGLKENRTDILELYERLSDYRSRQCLYGLLETWIHRENRILSLAKENGLEFWDMDIISTAENMVCADIGKHTAESLNGFIYTYEDSYQKIFCIPENQKDDLTAERESALRKTLSQYRDISLIVTELDRLRLDEVIGEPLDLIRIDVSTSLVPLLERSEEHIRKERPKLAICLDSDCNNIWRVPRLLKEWNPEYKFYLRYYGSKALSDRIILFAV